MLPISFVQEKEGRFVESKRTIHQLGISLDSRSIQALRVCFYITHKQKITYLYSSKLVIARWEQLVCN